MSDYAAEALPPICAALIDGALRAEVPRLFLLGHWQWLVAPRDAGVLARSPSLANALGLVLQVGATLLGCLLGYGVARGLRRAMRETRQKRSASSPVNRRGS
ncbi:TPA: hypothetical protein VDW96_003563 [Pseudomonas aeruginosa]|nr:hypothetical protein [Pseudomonas aeruginosa]